MIAIVVAVAVAALFTLWLRWTRADYDRIMDTPVEHDPRDFTSPEALRYHQSNQLGR